MKKLITLLLTLTMIVSLFVLPGSAPAETEAHATEVPAQTEAPKAEGGCSGMIAGAVAIIALLGTALVIKKRD